MVALLKLAYFIVERAAEPLSARLENAAARSDTFRGACSYLANLVNQAEYRKQQRRIARKQLSTDGWESLEDEVAPELTPEKATELGCQLMGEGFVLGIGILLLVHQVCLATPT